MAGDTPRFAGEKQRPSFLLVSQGIFLPPRELIYRGVGKNQCELKLGNGKTEHIESDGTAGAYRGEDFAEPLAVFSHTVDPAQHFITNVEVVSGKSEARHLDSFGRRNERLGDEQVRQVREAESFRRREQKAGAVIEWVVRKRGEARGPHQVGEEGGVG